MIKNGKDAEDWILRGIWLLLAALVGLCLLVPVDSAAQAGLAGASIVALWVLRLRAKEERKNLFRAVLLVLGAFVSLRYIIWRAMFTLGADDVFSWAFSLLLFAAEIYALVIHLTGIFVNFYPLKRKTPDFIPGQIVPSVDILVPSYNEPAELLDVTLRACLMARYPEDRKTVWLLDDGGTDQKIASDDPKAAQQARERRSELQALCARLGVRYLTRPRNEHAKAGNINHALKYASGDLVLILDADHVPTVDILEQTVPWLQRHDDVFLVQTPHFMVNPDPVDRNLLNAFHRMPAENEMFYQTVQRGLDFWEASFFCGSAAVLRRKHLDLVGGLAGDTITEDAETALALHAMGLRSVYLERPMVAGLAPESFIGFVIQRMRWTQGMTQILLLKNPALTRGLRWHQRLAYVSSASFWLFPFARIVYLLAPSAYLFFGLEIYNATTTQILVYTLPHVVSSLFVTSMLFQRTRWPFVSELYETMQSLYSIRALAQVIVNPRKPRFVVTPKGEMLEQEFVSPLARPFYGLLILTVLAFAAGATRFWGDPLTRDLTAVVMLWNSFNFVLVLMSFGALLERRQRRTSPRVPVQSEALIATGNEMTPCRIDDLSVGGARATFAMNMPALQPGTKTVLRVFVPALGRTEDFAVEIRAAFRQGKRQAIGVMFDPQNEAEQNAAVALVYGSSDNWRYLIDRRTRPMPFGKALGVMARLVAPPIARHLKVAIFYPITVFRRNAQESST